jgi:hypothetical protein
MPAAPPEANRRAMSPFAPPALEAHLAGHHETIAAFIVEPLVQGAPGMAMHDPHYLTLARELCTRYDVLLIADEIMTGFGRTGTMFACDAAGIAPISCACRKASPAATSRSRACCPPMRSMRRSMPMHRARLPAFAFVHGQPACLRGGAGRARYLPRRRRDCCNG